jgi:aromatic ring-opening dioxygenase catalytic subunit (LigB family)
VAPLRGAARFRVSFAQRRADALAAGAGRVYPNTSSEVLVPHPNRRAVLAGAAATAAVAATATWSTAMSAPKRQPVIYLPHGGGPWPWMQGHPLTSGTESLRAYLEALPRSMPEAPRAILAVTAHWEATVPTVSSGARPGMYYDYSGFPAHTYEIVWPAPGHPGLATRTRELLAAGGFSTAEDPNRGYDHGTFVPLAVAWPGAEVPTVQLSLVRGLDPETHLRMGRALAPLRDEGVLIVGSGMSYHNMRGFGRPEAAAASDAFDAWIGETTSSPRAVREERLRRWSEAPAARACHPREEHLLPLMVIAGAAGDDVGAVPFRDRILGTTVSAAHFG